MTASRTRFDPTLNYYQVLNVPVSASREEITRAYRQLMRLTHPDMFQEESDRRKAEDRAKLINAAYAVLSKPDLRLEYDRQLRSTAVSDALMQRYTGGSPGRPSPTRTSPRPPAPHVVRAQQHATRSAVRQILLSTAAFVATLLVAIIILVLAWDGLNALL